MLHVSKIYSKIIIYIDFKDLSEYYSFAFDSADDLYLIGDPKK